MYFMLECLKEFEFSHSIYHISFKITLKYQKLITILKLAVACKNTYEQINLLTNELMN